MVLDPSQDSEAYGLVSSGWIDYREFMMHELPSKVSSTLRLPDGEPVGALGFVAGTWTAPDLSRQAGGIRVIVVEAELMYGDQPVNFALNGCFYAGNAKDRKSDCCSISATKIITPANEVSLKYQGMSSASFAEGSIRRSFDTPGRSPTR